LLIFQAASGIRHLQRIAYNQSTKRNPSERNFAMTARKRSKHRPKGDTPPDLVISCEHGGNQIPAEYRDLFQGAGDVLESHRGWDPGALELAVLFAEKWQTPLFSTEVSRLLIELNRSLRHRALYSEFTRELAVTEKEALLSSHYHPYRADIEQHLEKCFAHHGRVIHIGVHTFTPVLNGETRNTDIGILYDPRHGDERTLAEAWRQSLRNLAPHLRVRMNYPYRGAADGLTTYFRRRFGKRYAGLELEVNQRWPLHAPREWPEVQEILATSIAGLLGD
jgi:predicted N-formylglutamate amidohydrolase